MVDVKKLTNFLKSETEFLKDNDDYAGAYLKLDDTYSVVLSFEDGFYGGDNDVIHSKENPRFALVAAIRITNPDYTPDMWEIPHDKKSGDLYLDDYTVSTNEDFEGLAQRLINDYEYMTKEIQPLLDREEEVEIEDEVEEACGSKLKESTGNFRVQDGLPILAFEVDVEDYTDEKETSKDIRILSEDEYYDLEDELEVANEKFWAKYHEIMDDKYETDYDNYEPLYSGEVEFRIESGYYEGAQVIVKGYENIQTKELKEFAKKLYLEIGKKFNLTKLERAYVFSNGETGYKKVEESAEVKKTAHKKVNENFGDDTLDDLVERAVMNYEEGNDIEEAVRYAIGEGLIYTKDIFALAGRYISASEVLGLYYEELFDELYGAVAEELKEKGEVVESAEKNKKIVKKELKVTSELDDWDDIKPLDITDEDLKF